MGALPAQGHWCWQSRGEVLALGLCSTVASLKTKNRTTIGPSNSTLGYIYRKDRNTNLKRYTHPNVHRSITYNSQGMETTKVSINRWMNEEDAVYKCRGKILSLKNKKEEENFTIYNNMWVELEGPKLREISQIKTKTMILLIVEKKMTTYSSILAWKAQWTEEPGRLQSMGSQKVEHDLATGNQSSLVNRI